MVVSQRQWMTGRMDDDTNAVVDATAPLLLAEHRKKMEDDEIERRNQQQQLPLETETTSPLGTCRAKLVAILNLLFVTLPILIFVDGLRLFLFVIFLAPAFAQFVWYYCVTSHRMVRRYSPNSCRTTLDIYGSTTTTNSTTSTTLEPKKPVLLFFPGGAWLIGYKMWGALLAKAMTPQYLVIICDYRNYSIVGIGGATVPTMVDDVHDAILWTFANCETFGGDSRKIILVGQSAGGHLCACLLLRKVLEKLHRQQQQQQLEQQQQQQQLDPYSSPSDASGQQAPPQSSLLDSSSSHSNVLHDRHTLDDDNHNTTNNNSNNDDDDKDADNEDDDEQEHARRHDFDPTDLAGFVSLSAPFHLQAMKSTLARHGLGGYCDQGLINRMFEFKMNEYDPQLLLTQCCEIVAKQQQQQQQQQHQPLQQQQQQQQTHHHYFVSHYLPPVAIFHGTKDKTVPYQGSRTFYRTLAQLPKLDDGDEEDQPTTSPMDESTAMSTSSSSSPSSSTSVQLHLYTGWSHTDPILEGLFDGDHRFHMDLHRLVHQWTMTTTSSTTTTPVNEPSNPLANSNSNNDDDDNSNRTNESQTRDVLPSSTEVSLEDLLRQQRRMCPHMLVSAARWVNPF